MSVAELNEVFSQGRHVIERLVGQHVRVEFNLTPMNVVVRGTIIELEWLMLNLASNASDAMPDGSELTIETDLVSVPVGMTADADGQRLPFGAFGLGLTSATVLSRRLGGFLRVARTGPHGTSLEA